MCFRASDSSPWVLYPAKYRIQMIDSTVTVAQISYTDITVTNSGPFPITANVRSGYIFSRWTFTGSGKINNTSSPSASLIVYGDMTVTANYTPIYSVRMINSSITANGSTSSNTTVTVIGSGPFPISAIIPSGYTFSGWTFTGSGSISGTSSASLTVNSDMTVTANFTLIPTYTVTMINSTITVDTTTYTTVTVTGSGPFSINAVIPPGNTFSGWTFTGSGSISGTSSASLTVNSDMTVTAIYTPNPPPTYRVIMINSTITLKNGTTSSDTLVPADSYTITADIIPESTFSGWSVDGGGTISDNVTPSSLTVIGNVTVTANYTPNPPPTYRVIMINSTITLKNGTTSSDTLVPADSYTITADIIPESTFSGWSVDGGGTISDNVTPSSLTVTGDVTVTANYISPMIIKLKMSGSNDSDPIFDIPIIFEGAQTVDVDWGDGTVISGYNSTNLPIHTYNPPRGPLTTYIVKIFGTASGYGGRAGYYNGVFYIREIVQWGTLGMTQFPSAFYYCFYLTTVPPTFVPNVTDVNRMFYRCYNLICDISLWDISKVTNTSEMFSGASKFNSNLSSWDVSGVTNMAGMFSGAEQFNQPLNGWIVQNVTDMSFMFSGAFEFNQPLDSWNVSGVTNMAGMFAGNNSTLTKFNQDISGWNINLVEDAANMFDTSTMCDHHDYWPAFGSGVGGYPNFGCSSPPPL